MTRRRALSLLLLVALATGLTALLWPAPPPVLQTRTLPLPGALAARCDELAPRVEMPADGVFVAIGYDLANTILIRTSAGNVVVDAGMSPRARPRVRDALLRESPGPVVALIYTHSHIDHVGGARAWTGPNQPPQIWATDAFAGHFIKQYEALRAAETRRGEQPVRPQRRPRALPCSALGRRPDLEHAGSTGARMPTHSFSGASSCEIGDTDIELHEAHGETHDHLFVHLPARRTLLPGDNYYAAFPNLYTLRGTSPRPIRAWIDSLDAHAQARPRAS
jgi:glyoxylase-like metal-dependent hydrolase (beta-lactamase superfamily II)